MKSKLERKTDSLLFTLANKPWSAAFLAVLALGLFLCGILTGAALG